MLTYLTGKETHKSVNKGSSSLRASVANVAGIITAAAVNFLAVLRFEVDSAKAETKEFNLSND